MYYFLKFSTTKNNHIFVQYIAAKQKILHKYDT